MDPGLPYLLSLSTEEEAATEARKAFLKQTAQNFQPISVPIFASNHWTLWLLRKKAMSRLSWRRYDSLAEPSEATELAQVRMGTFMDPEFQMAQKAIFEPQEQGSLACGFFVLTWMEKEHRLQRGEGLRTWVQFSEKH